MLTFEYHFLFLANRGDYGGDLGAGAGPTEPDNVDDAPDPDVDEGAPGAEALAPAAQKITTKFLTKYERGEYFVSFFFLLSYRSLSLLRFSTHDQQSSQAIVHRDNKRRGEHELYRMSNL